MAEGRWLGLEAPFDREERLAHMTEALVKDDEEVFVAAAANDVVGQVWVSVRPYGVADLGMLVAPAWRNRGVGSALLDAAVGWAKDAGAHKVSLQLWPHNRAAAALYRNHGFVEEGLLRRHYRRQNGELWDAVIMGLVLDESSPGSSQDG